MSCDNVPTTSEIAQAKKDVSDFNTFMTSTSNTFIDSKGVSRLTLQGAINKFGFGIADFTFTEGGNLLDHKLLVSNDPIDGFLYRYVGTGTFPITVTAGTDPTSNTDWEAFTATSAEFISNANGGSIQDFIDETGIELSSQIQITPPSLPAITNRNKFFMSWGEANVRGYIVTKHAIGKFSAAALTTEVAAADSANTGGASNVRLGKVLQCSALKIAKTKAFSKTAGVVISSLTTDQIKAVWGYTSTSLFKTVTKSSPDFGWDNPNVYTVPYSAGANESIVYAVNSGSSAKAIFGVTTGSSNNVLIEISINGGVTYIPYATIDTSGGSAGLVIRKEFDIYSGFNGVWYVRITNKTTAVGSSAYVAGLNIMDLPDSGKPDFESVILQISGGVSTDLSYQMVNGANEFAALESSTGKFFGTYHGGHSGFIDLLRTDSSTVNLRESLTNFAYISTCFELYSQSILTSSGGVSLNYSAITQFGDGCNITTYSVRPTSHPSITCDKVFTHMCTTAPSFERVILPIYAIKTDDGLLSIGNVQHCKQDRAFDVASLRTWWSGVSSSDNIYDGAYISFLPNYNKQYYGPIIEVESEFKGGMFVTAKEYL